MERSLTDMSLQLSLGNAAIRAFRRLPYQPWYALAEFIDNSTQSFFDHRSELENDFVELSIVFDPGNREISIVDNAFGMSEEDMKRALEIGNPSSNPMGRSRYGMGMKTASCWFGDRWVIQSKQKGSPYEIEFSVDVEKFADGDPTATSTQVRNKDVDMHYTRIILSDVSRQMHPSRVKEIARNLTSIFRKDIAGGILRLSIDNDPVEYTGYQSTSFLERSSDGGRYLKEFNEVVGGIRISGWIGCFAPGKGGQSEAGISVFQNNRCIMGASDAWRPSSLYGQARGGVVNQKLVGEINLDDPSIQISHTKDQVLWQGTQQDDIEDFLKRIASDTDILRVARQTYRDTDSDQVKRDAGLSAFQEWSVSPGLINQLSIQDVPLPEYARTRTEFVLEATREVEPDFEVSIPGIEKKIMIKVQDLSPNDAYCSYEITSNNDLVTVINSAHPGYATASRSENPLFTYFVHCAIDTWAEWKCQLLRGEIFPESVREIKNDILRHSPDI
jgi:hypothetical protein